MTTETKPTAKVESDKYTVSGRYRFQEQAFPYYGPHRIGESFDTIGHELVLVITPQQAESYERVVARQGGGFLKSINLEFGRDPALLLTFEHIVIGIEPDGYSHS